jgi:hypothetical protein
MLPSGAPTVEIMRRRWTSTSIVLLVLTVGLWSVLLTQWWRSNLFPLLDRVDPESPAGIATLRGIASKSQPLLEGLGKYRLHHGGFPAELRPLAGTYIKASRNDLEHSQWNEWRYWGQGDSFGIYTKLGQDPMLRFDRGPTGGRWIYDPGDGGGRTTLPFHIAGE